VKIAGEKAGIIKHGIPVIVSERQPGIETVFQSTARVQQAPIFFATDQFEVTSNAENGIIHLTVFENGERLLENLVLPLQGIYQQKNLGGVMQAIALLRTKGWKISMQDMRTGLEHVVMQTGLKGRWQVLGTHPLIVCDTGHNLDGISEALRQIATQSFQNLILVFGMVKGKDISAILEILPKHAYYFFCQPDIPRALEATVLLEQATAHRLAGEVVTGVNEAIQRAKKSAGPDDMIFIGGSTYVVAEIDEL
jgi:dihydrofolate synthase/folylpolyglutamate synthase